MGFYLKIKHLFKKYCKCFNLILYLGSKEIPKSKIPFSSEQVEMFYLNTIEQLIHFVEQLDQLEVCLPYSRLVTGIPTLAVFQNLWWCSNKTSQDLFQDCSLDGKGLWRSSEGKI